VKSFLLLFLLCIGLVSALDLPPVPETPPVLTLEIPEEDAPSGGGGGAPGESDEAIEELLVIEVEGELFVEDDQTGEFVPASDEIKKDIEEGRLKAIRPKDLPEEERPGLLDDLPVSISDKLKVEILVAAGVVALALVIIFLARARRKH